MWMGTSISLLFGVLSSVIFASKDIDPLTSIYYSYDEVPGFHHWIEYGKSYHENFQHLLGKDKIQMLEIGVQSGGSTRVWSQYFGKKLNYTGVDLDARCVQFELPERGIHIEIGNQKNISFLEDLCKKFGPFDIIIDDGGHTTDLIMTSLEILFLCMRDGGVYAVEDLHSMSMWREHPTKKKLMFVDGKNFYQHLGDIMGRMVEYMRNYRFRYPNAFLAQTDKFISHLSKVNVYDSLAFLHYRETWKPITEFSRGKKFITGFNY